MLTGAAALISDGAAAWPVVQRDAFDTQSGWYAGEQSNDSFDTFQAAAVAGIYRLSFALRDGVYDYQWVSAPYPSATEFPVDLDVRIAMASGDRVFAALTFGKTGDGEYRLWVDNNECGLMRQNGGTWTELVACVSPPIDLSRLTRIGIAVLGGDIRGYVNGVEAFEYRDASFPGGNIRLAVGSDRAGDSGDVEFDNVSFRRPR